MNTYNDTTEYVMKKFYRVHGDESPLRLRYKRNEMAEMFRDLGYRTGAEIGVYTGEYSEMLCMKNPELHLYCIDPWMIYDSEEIEPFSQNQLALTIFYEETKKRLDPYNTTIMRKESVRALKEFEADSLDFVYIDANHDYKHMSEDLEGWAQKVRSGGIVSGHDYGHFKHRDRNIQTKRAIDEYVEKHGITLFLVNQNYQTTWFFVKR